MGQAGRLLLSTLLAIAVLLPAASAWAAPLPQGGQAGAGALGTWKSVLTTVLLAVALLQCAGQALARGWIRSGSATRRLGGRLHRPGGIVAFLLAWLVFALCMYAMWGPGGGTATLSSPRVLAHAVLGGGLLFVLSAKAVISNFLRRQLRLNVPLGIAAFVLSLGVWLTSAMPHLFNFYW